MQDSVSLTFELNKNKSMNCMNDKAYEDGHIHMQIEILFYVEKEIIKTFIKNKT